ncbi:hypothetical protein BO71DRAFT_440914 [Aspergillus ellipticus CBS 707.79]|uniref:Uncharacterized protein n=1 Tax=Aspergillus ellipticus CBS 707.79 TaxID=1448320 RepID=A0A319DKK7_9EURO|nr:hypothetical protein BO71DRAFT_440914 [Aspergillus ellipticus CBS 707.79]
MPPISYPIFRDGLTPNPAPEPVTSTSTPTRSGIVTYPALPTEPEPDNEAELGLGSSRGGYRVSKRKSKGKNARGRGKHRMGKDLTVLDRGAGAEVHMDMDVDQLVREDEKVGLDRVISEDSEGGVHVKVEAEAEAEADGDVDMRIEIGPGWDEHVDGDTDWEVLDHFYLEAVRGRVQEQGQGEGLVGTQDQIDAQIQSEVVTEAQVQTQIEAQGLAEDRAQEQAQIDARVQALINTQAHAQAQAQAEAQEKDQLQAQAQAEYDARLPERTPSHHSYSDTGRPQTRFQPYLVSQSDAGTYVCLNPPLLSQDGATNSNGPDHPSQTPSTMAYDENRTPVPKQRNLQQDRYHNTINHPDNRNPAIPGISPPQDQGPSTVTTTIKSLVTTTIKATPTETTIATTINSSDIRRISMGVGMTLPPRHRDLSLSESEISLLELGPSLTAPVLVYKDVLKTQASGDQTAETREQTQPTQLTETQETQCGNGDVPDMTSSRFTCLGCMGSGPCPCSDSSSRPEQVGTNRGDENNVETDTGSGNEAEAAPTDASSVGGLEGLLTRCGDASRPNHLERTVSLPLRLVDSEIGNYEQGRHCGNYVE